MAVVTMECPLELSVALGKRLDDTVKEVQFMAALKLYESGRISSGLAAKLAGISRPSFLLQCGQYGVSIFQQTGDELEKDVKAVSDAGGR